MVVGIDASRNRSGGARAHLLGIIRHFDENLGVKLYIFGRIKSFLTLLAIILG